MSLFFRNCRSLLFVYALYHVQGKQFKEIAHPKFQVSHLRKSESVLLFYFSYYVLLKLIFLFFLDLAVVIENRIQLFSNGVVIKTKERPFTSLKALVYDNIRDQFIVSDTHKANDTVYTVPVAIDITVPIIKGLPGDIQVYINDTSYL